MTEREHAALREAGYTHTLLRRKLLADTLTPVAIYQRLGAGRQSYLLESIEGGERWARFSVVGLPAGEWITAKNGEIRHYVAHRLVEKTRENPLDWLRRFHRRRRVANIPEDLPFAGGLVGYFGYDSIAYIEKRLAERPENDPLALPDLLFLVSEAMVVLDNLRGEANILLLVPLDEDEAHKRAEARVEEIAARLAQPFSAPPLDLRPPRPENFRARHEMGEEGYKAAVRKIKAYIIAGDVMQVVPSQRMSVAYRRDPFDLYRALRITNPSPYMYFLDMGDHQIVGSSPEILVRAEGRKVTVRPIAGTRRRGGSAEEDRQLAKELLGDEKERAEHIMLIDLGRNDIGRVCTPGTVRISEKMTVERYSHVMHIVSNVEGEMSEDIDALDVFRATFPAGTLTGASKVRAMEVIDELETSRRGVYGGAVGYWSFRGDMDLAIAIRTGVIKAGRLYVQAGGGIVHDSDPDGEWQETLNKLGALIKAASMLPGGTS